MEINRPPNPEFTGQQNLEQEKERLVAEVVSLRPKIRSYVQAHLETSYPTAFSVEQIMAVLGLSGGLLK